LLGNEQQSSAGSTQRTNKQAQKNKTMVINTNPREAKESKGAQWWLKAHPQLEKKRRKRQCQQLANMLDW
jgi:type II secretory pathway component PulF